MKAVVSTRDTVTCCSHAGNATGLGRSFRVRAGLTRAVASSLPFEAR